MRLILLILIFTTVASASDCLKELKKSFRPKTKSLKIEHAKGFEVHYFNSVKLVIVKHPWRGAKHSVSYLLSKNVKGLAGICKNILRVKTPIKRLASLSTTHLPSLNYLNEVESLIGFSNLRFVSTKSVRKRINRGKVKEIGYPPNPEVLISIRPDVVMAYVSEDPEIEGIARLARAGLPVIYNSEYREKSPLARAEWIKFISLFFNKEQDAMKIFKGIETRYKRVRTLVKKVNSRPIVMVGSLSGGIWQAPGGKSDFAKFIEDAGGRYLWNKNQSNGRVVIKFEKILKESGKANIWLPQNRWHSLKSALADDLRYRLLKPFKFKNLFNNNAKWELGRGSDYWETGIMRPDILLSDLVKIIHPELLPDHNLYWYKKLK